VVGISSAARRRPASEPTAPMNKMSLFADSHQQWQRLQHVRAPMMQSNAAADATASGIASIDAMAVSREEP